MLKKLDPKDFWVRKFEVPEVRRHKKGFTVYKVVSVVFPRNFPDAATKITVWKRFKDFKNLHKELDLIFHQLYLKGKFPELPSKDNYFGRFDDAVIEERRKSALQLLEFAANYQQLFMDKVFVKFFEDGHLPKDFVGENNGVEETEESVLVEEEDVHFQDCLVPERKWTTPPPKDDATNAAAATEDTEERECSSPSFSCTSDPSQTTPSTQNENGGGGVPQEDFNFIPQIVAVPTSSPSRSRSSSPTNQTRPNVVTFSDSSPRNSQFASSSSNSILPPAPYSLQDTKFTSYLGSSTSLNEELDYLEEEFQFIHNPEGESRLPSSASTLSLDLISNPEENLRKNAIDKHKKSSGFNLFDFLPIFSKKPEQNTPTTTEQFSSYVREAAGYFTVAQNHESNSDIKEALEAYTEGIQILLEGAQGDTDAERRVLVKKKVQKYLSHAEELKRSLKIVGLDSLNASAGQYESISSSGGGGDFVLLNDNVMPSYIEDLRNYKVVGCTFSNVLVVVDTTTGSGGPDCFAIKVLRKSPSPIDPEKPSLIPSDIPFMVQLLKWYNTDDAIVLVLRYAAGGRLLNFVESYQTKELSILQPSRTSSNCDVDKNCVAPEESPLLLEEVTATLKPPPPLMQEKCLNLQPAPPEPKPVVVQDLRTEALLENSRALLDTVSKTLENHRRMSLPTSVTDDESQPKPHPPAASATATFTFLGGGDSSSSPPPPTAWRFDRNPSQEEEDQDGSSPTIVRMLPERCVKVWAAELVIAVDRLHAQGITYGDLDINNILLGDNGHILLTYRALWNEVDSESSWNDSSAPEVVNSWGRALWKCHPSADWWSLGAILYYLVVGSNVQDNHPEGIYPQTVICVPSVNIVNEVISPTARSLLVELLQYTPTLRLGYYGAEEIKSHPFFGELDWTAAEAAAIATTNIPNN